MSSIKEGKMNKELKKQVVFHGNQINNLLSRVYKIEDKVMRENYSIYANCPNCHRSQEITVAIGQKRPNKYKCEHCRCEVEPKTFSFYESR